MANEPNNTAFLLPEGERGDVRLASARHAVANVGDFHSKEEEYNMTTEETVVTETNPYADAVSNLVKVSGKVDPAQTSYLAIALPLLIAEEDKETKANALIADICVTAKVTSSKGKANPNALKANGHAMLAEVSRLLRKVAKHYASNIGVAVAVDGFLGVIADAAHYETELAAFPNMVKAKEAEDDKAIARAERDFTKGYLARMYPERPLSFSALRSAIDKATKPEGTDANAPAETGEGEGGGVSVSDAAVIIGADDMAQALVGRLAELSEEAFTVLFDAMRADLDRRLADVSEEERKAA